MPPWKMADRLKTKAVLASALLILSTGCAEMGKPPPAVSVVPDSVMVKFHTDPMTGKTDGPFDPETGRRVLTRIGEDGVLRVVIDPVTHLPVTAPADGGPEQAGRP
jgi:hypothetical protein